MKNIRQDILYALRRLVKAPGFSALIVITLGLGIGVNTAVFTVVNSLLIRPLPYQDPNHLVVLWETKDNHQIPVSVPNFTDWQKQVSTLARVAFYGPEMYTFRSPSRSEKVAGEWVSASYFPTLGVPAEVGRFFTEEEVAQGIPVAVLGHSLWQSRFGSDRGAIGRTIELNKVPLTIIGVMPRGFRGFSGDAEVFVPVTQFEKLLPFLAQYHILEDRNTHWGNAVARLKPGVSIETARADLQTIAARLQSAYPQFNKGQSIEIQDARENLVGDLRPKLLRLLGAVLFVLLIACANVANLLLARAADRGKEIAVRTAMGASRLQIIRQLLVESLLMALLGGALALLLVRWSLTLLLAFIPLKIPGFIEISVDGPVLTFVLVVALVSSVLVGLVPALYSSRPNLSGTLKEGGGRGSTESRVSRRTRSALVIADVALALILLIGAGLMIRSLSQIRSFDAGVRPDNLLTLTFEPAAGTEDARRVQIKQQVLDRAAALPGVRSAALTSHLLYDRGYLTQEVTVKEHQLEDPARVQTYYVSQGYFQTLGITVEAGRGFMPQDNAETAPVAIVNHAFANRYWSGGDPVGKQIKIGKATEEGPYLTIVGVVGNVRTKIEPGTPDQPIQMYLPGMRSATWGYNLVVSTEKDPTRMTSSLREAIQQVDPGVSMYNVDTLRSRMSNATSDTRFFTGMMGVFAGLALILAVLGIYGLISYTVNQQQREIAVRMALGAMSGDIFRLVVVRGLLLTLAGLGIGLVTAFALSQSIAKFLFGVSQTDALTFLGMPVILGLTALIACWLPARRAVKVDPLTSLRYD